MARSIMDSMTWLALKILSWVLHAAMVMASVAAVSKNNPRNTLGRALAVTFLVAAVVTPLSIFWILIVPLILAGIAWIVIYMMAYGLGPLQAIGPLAKAVGQAVFEAVGIRPDRVLPAPARSLPKTSSGKLMRPGVADLVRSGALPPL